MIHAHAELYSRLSSVQTFALWAELHRQHLVDDAPDLQLARGEVLAEKCRGLSHAEVVMSIAHRSETFWSDVLCVILRKPIYLCAKGETGVEMTDVLGRPLPLPIGHRRGEPVGTGGMPRKIASRLGGRVQYQRKFDPRVITVLADRNPKQPTSKAYTRFQMYYTGMTVTEYTTLGGTMSDIVHDTAKGHIKVDMP
jgi:hypothetical protein